MLENKNEQFSRYFSGFKDRFRFALAYVFVVPISKINAIHYGVRASASGGSRGLAGVHSG
jgi:hypothetical protein